MSRPAWRTCRRRTGSGYWGHPGNGRPSGTSNGDRSFQIRAPTTPSILKILIRFDKGDRNQDVIARIRDRDMSEGVSRPTNPRTANVTAGFQRSPLGKFPRLP